MATTVNNQRPPLVFWLSSPAVPGAGLFTYISNHWGNEVHCVCNRPLTAARKGGGWKERESGKQIFHFLSEMDAPEHFLRSFTEEHRESIHFGNGLCNPTTRKWLFSIPNVRLALYSERPRGHGSAVRQMARRYFGPIVHRWRRWKYSPVVRVMFPLGTLGVQEYQAYGWDANLLYPLMYNPQLASRNAPRVTRSSSDTTIRFIYVGRFDRRAKGVDILLQAFDRTQRTNWHLDLVGGYGEYADAVINWAKKCPRATFAGTWPSDEIVSRMAEYDVCLVPNRIDGWNVTVNEAIHAGIGVITTHEAVSDEMITASGAGLVVPGNDLAAFRAAIESVLDTPRQTDIWKEKARAYEPRISSKSVGDYAIAVLDNVFLDPSLPRPQCPWL